MSNIEKIRQKLDLLYDGEAPKHDQQCDFNDGYFTGIATISNFIDSLPKEKPSDDLNDEIKKFIEEYGYERGVDKLLIAIVARHFAEWQKEQMMKDAVDYKIVNNLAAYPVIYYEVDHLGLKYGDKVKMIILKDGE